MKPAGERLAGLTPGPAAEPQPSPAGAAGPEGPRAAHPQPFPRRYRGSGAPSQPAPHKARRAMNKTSPGDGGEGIGIREIREWKAKRGSGPAENRGSSPRPLIRADPALDAHLGSGARSGSPGPERAAGAGTCSSRAAAARIGEKPSEAERPLGERARRGGAGGAGAEPSPRGGAARPPGPRGVRGVRAPAPRPHTEPGGSGPAHRPPRTPGGTGPAHPHTDPGVLGQDSE